MTCKLLKECSGNMRYFYNCDYMFNNAFMTVLYSFLYVGRNLTIRKIFIRPSYPIRPHITKGFIFLVYAYFRPMERIYNMRAVYNVHYHWKRTHMLSSCVLASNAIARAIYFSSLENSA